jgi:NAD(P)H dehydrogenase (quinone)
MSVIITGASGKLGRLAAEETLIRVPASEVVLTTRHPEDLADFAARGVQVRYADFDRPESLPAAFADGHRMLLISATNATGLRMDQHRAAMSAAARSGVEHVVFTSMPKVEDVAHPTGLLAEEYRDSEALVKGSGLDWTILRMAPYAELHIIERMHDAILEGAIASNATSGGVAFISRRDCAAAAAGLLAAGGHQGRTYDVTGPSSVTYTELVQMLSDIVGRPIEFRPLSDDELRALLAEQGVPEMFAVMFVGWGPAVRDGYYAGISSAGTELAGRPPRPLHSVLADNRDKLLAPT